MFNQLGLIGCGLMGGSFALALQKAGLVKRVVGYSKSPSTTERRSSSLPTQVKTKSASSAAAAGVSRHRSARPVPAGTGRSAGDADMLVYAMRDPESREATARYLAQRK